MLWASCCMLLAKVLAFSLTVFKNSSWLGILSFSWIWVLKVVIAAWASRNKSANCGVWLAVCWFSTSLAGKTLPSATTRTTANATASMHLILLMSSPVKVTESSVNWKTTDAQNGPCSPFYRNFLSKRSKCVLSHFDDNGLSIPLYLRLSIWTCSRLEILGIPGNRDNAEDWCSLAIELNFVFICMSLFLRYPLKRWISERKWAKGIGERKKEGDLLSDSILNCSIQLLYFMKLFCYERWN